MIVGVAVGAEKIESDHERPWLCILVARKSKGFPKMHLCPDLRQVGLEPKQLAPPFFFHKTIWTIVAQQEFLYCYPVAL